MLGVVIPGLLILRDLDEFNKIFVEALEALGYLFGCRHGVLIELVEGYGKLWVITVVCIKRRASRA